MSKKIEWLKRDYIREQGKKSKKAATFCSRDHWLQLWQATNKQLTKALEEETTSICRDTCALCVRYYNNNCCNCPLSCLYASNSLWHKAANCQSRKMNNKCFRKWKKAAKALYEKLNELCNKYN